jgi:hypothetical protein
MKPIVKIHNNTRLGLSLRKSFKIHLHHPEKDSGCQAEVFDPHYHSLNTTGETAISTQLPPPTSATL